MTKKHKNLHNEQLLITLMVSLVAIVAIIAGANSSGQAIAEPITNCKEVSFCSVWDYEEREQSFCLEKEFVETKECVGYEVINGEIACNDWNTDVVQECVDWDTEVVYDKVCLDRQIKEECFISE